MITLRATPLGNAIASFDCELDPAVHQRHHSRRFHWSRPLTTTAADPRSVKRSSAANAGKHPRSSTSPGKRNADSTPAGANSKTRAQTRRDRRDRDRPRARRLLLGDRHLHFPSRPHQPNNGHQPLPLDKRSTIWATFRSSSPGSESDCTGRSRRRSQAPSGQSLSLGGIPRPGSRGGQDLLYRRRGRPLERVCPGCDERPLSRSAAERAPRRARAARPASAP
jgi:hypothetical protein